MRLGAKVVHKGSAKIHVSGHASAAELLYTYNIVQPKGVMPVHGEWRHLLANGELARQTGVPEDRIVLAENGYVVDLVDGVPSIVGAHPTQDLFVDGSSVGGITEADLKDRLTLAGEGFVSIFMAVDGSRREIIAGPEIHTRGVAEDANTFATIAPKIETAVLDALRNGTKDRHQLQQIIRRTIGRWISSKLRRKPMIVPQVVVL
jgi:ribonuclease J